MKQPGSNESLFPFNKGGKTWRTFLLTSFWRDLEEKVFFSQNYVSQFTANKHFNSLFITYSVKENSSYIDF